MKKFPLIFYMFILWITMVILPVSCSIGQDDGPSILQVSNPVTSEYIRDNLRPQTPRLILNQDKLGPFLEKVQSDPVVSNVYQAIRKEAKLVIDQPLLQRDLIGRRLLNVSRQMLHRMNVLATVYLVEKDQVILERINDELLAVCQFEDWNPAHFLDVAEMAMAVSLALDWTGDALPELTVAIAKEALGQKALLPSFEDAGHNWWIDRNNNWNQVCHAGMIAAAITLAEERSDLASKTISRALENIPFGMGEYAPDGVYPEGSTYWEYGTMFTVLTIDMLESALGSDFGIAQSPGFMESAEFRVRSVAPSGQYFNFADCGDKRSSNGDFTLAWFAKKTGNAAFFETERFLQDPADMPHLARHVGAGLVWLSEFEPISSGDLKANWHGGGANPVAIFSNANDQSYLGVKGGKGTLNHGNMDAGSFVFELDGIRWFIDPGNQNYHDLEKIGFQLWHDCQECDRWKLLTKNNFGHNTITVNGDLHLADGFAAITEVLDVTNPSATIDLTPVFADNLKSARRRFILTEPRSFQIEDQFEVNQETETITLQFLTQARVELKPGGAVLSQEGRKLLLEIESHPQHMLKVISLDPPPLDIDRRIQGLKRIDITFEKSRDINGKLLEVRTTISG
jgi:hypothetical protein